MSTDTTDAPQLLLPAEQAMSALGGISRKTLFNITAPRGGLKPTKIGARVMYSVREIERFIAEREGK